VKKTSDNIVDKFIANLISVVKYWNE